MQLGAVKHHAGQRRLIYPPRPPLPERAAHSVREAVCIVLGLHCVPSAAPSLSVNRAEPVERCPILIHCYGGGGVLVQRIDLRGNEARTGVI